MEQELIDFLKKENARLSCDGDKWMYWDDNGEWVVLEHGYGKRKNRELYSGQNLTLALAFLKGDN